MKLLLRVATNAATFITILWCGSILALSNGVASSAMTKMPSRIGDPISINGPLYTIRNIKAFQKNGEQQQQQLHRQLNTYVMQLNSTTAKFGPGKSNEFIVVVDHNDVSEVGVTIVETFLNPACSSSSNTAGISGGDITVQSSPKKLTGIIQANLASLGSAVWTAGSTQGTVSFCYRLEAVVASVVQNSVDIVVTALVDMDDVYSMYANYNSGLGAWIPDTITVQVDYPLTIFICDNSAVEVVSPPAILEGGTLQVCISYTGAVAGVEVGSIYDATIYQTSGFTLATVVDGTVQHAFTTIDCTTVAHTCRIKTNLVRDFWDVNSAVLTFSGTVLMAIGRRRYLADVPSTASTLSDSTKDKLSSSFAFPFEIALEEVSLLPTTSGFCRPGHPSFLRTAMLAIATVTAVLWDAIVSTD